MNDAQGTPDRDARLEELFHAALEQPVAARDDFLRGACAGDDALRLEVCDLLSAHDDAPACLETPAWAIGQDVPLLDADLSGTRIGPYAVRELLGEGGMGSVYLAEQVEPFRRRVALKLIKLGMDTAEVVSRFNSERQALAQLSHPNIAAVHDAGVTPRGRPYFVMEYVAGERITEYCERRKLSLDERLRVFLDVCRAVQHAHCKGIIHRDLKPSNVLVQDQDGGPQPKIIDFGVAKATSGPARRRTISTRQGQLIGTPGYMSPEQAGARDADVDSRTDVYALGALLYELLCGCQPLDRRALRRADDDEVRRLLRESELLPPSARCLALGNKVHRVAARRRMDVRALVRRLRRDLDWIALRALEGDPARRYASASELAADVVAHLSHESVSAGPPSWLDRGRRVVSRHRRLALAGAGALVVGALALGASSWQGYLRGQELSDHNALLVAEKDEIQFAHRELVEERDALQSACDAAAREVGLDPDLRASLVRNAGPGPLVPGELVQLVELAEGPDGRPLLLVDRARRQSDRPVLGTLGGSAELVDVDTFHLHRDDGPVAAGAYGVLARPGPVTTLRVDGSDGPIASGQLLGLSSVAGLAGPRQPGTPVVARALQGWDAPGVGVIHAYVSPAIEAASGPDAWLASVLAHRDTTVLVRDGARPGPQGAPGGGAESTLDGVPPGEPLVVGAGAAWSSVAQVGASAVAGGSDPGPTPQALTPADEPGVGPSGETSAADQFFGTRYPAGPFAVGSLGGGALEPAEGQHLPPDGGAQPLELPAPPAPLPGGGNGTGGGGQTPPTPPGGTLEGGLPPEDEATGGGEHGDVSPDGPASSDGHADLGSLGALPEELAMTSEADEVLQHSWADVDGDGLEDLLLSTSLSGSRLLRNAGQGVFQDITPWSNLADLQAHTQAQWIDVDSDARVDLLVVDVDGRLRIWRGLGDGVFADTTHAAGLGQLPEVAQVASFDSNGDLRSDLRVLTAEGSLVLLVNDGTGRFAAHLIHGPALPEHENAPRGGDLGSPQAGTSSPAPGLAQP